MLTADLKKQMQEIIDDCMGDAPAACVSTCPVHTDVKGYVNLIREGDYKGSIKLIRERLPFPAIMGRICAHPCEDKCKRGEVEEAMSIAALKRFAAEFDDERDWDLTIADEKKEKVAIIGAGPAGAMAAIELRKKGYQVTVFEKLNVLGGMLRVGIPAYRLPRNIIDFEYSLLDKLGVQVKTNIEVGKDISIDELKQNYDAIFIAIGAHKSIMLPLPGSDLLEVLSGVDFLRKASLGKPIENLGKKVVVVGGGNVAVDVARSARRLGVAVEMVCLEQIKEMPAHEWEIEETIEEGIKIHTGWGPVEYVGENSRVSGLKVKECPQVFNSDGQFSPIYKENNTKIIEADTVIMAIGQAADSTAIAEKLGFKVNRGGKFDVNPLTLETNIAGIFAGGDAAGRPLLAIEACGHGLKAAISIDKYLCGEDVSIGRENEGSYETKLEKEIDENESKKKRILMKMMDPQERIKTFDEIAYGFSEEEALLEAQRCLQCECKLCMQECEMLNDFCECPKDLFIQLIEGEVDPIIPYSCNMCSQCTIACPKDFDIKDRFMTLRKLMVKANNGKSPMKGHQAIEMHQALGFSKLFNTAKPASSKRRS